VPESEIVRQLAQLALALENAQGLEPICEALESGRLETGFSAATRVAIAGGNAIVDMRLRQVGELWVDKLMHLSGANLALILRSSAAAGQQMRQQLPRIEVVWSGPKVEYSFLRATREVVRELLRSVRRELLVVGYWLAAHDEGEGIIEEFVASLAAAVARGVTSRVVFDERIRPDGKDNRQVLVSAWPNGVQLPELLTWRLPHGDQHLKLHAKVLVADRQDALVTSANLTFYAMDRNMEMGVRLIGAPAADIARHFELLAISGTFEPFASARTVP